MQTILTLKPTAKGDWLRGGPLQVEELKKRAPAEKWLRPVTPADYIIFEKTLETKGNFTKIKLFNAIAGEKYWWVYRPSFDLPKEEEKVPAVHEGLPESVKLSLPYLSQRDNERNPGGSCNVTSVAMCLGFFGHPLINSDGVQLEDHLYWLCELKGLDRHSPYDLATLIKGFGYKDDFQADAKWHDVKSWLASGNPCICHNFLTRSGHLIAICGFNDKGWIVNDPWGEWCADGYDTSASGEGLTYSYELMRRTAGPDGDLWIHYVSR